MTFFATSATWTCAGALVLIGLGACEMPNPAFEDDGSQADEVGDSGDTRGDTTADESGESGESDSNSDTNDADASTDADTTDADSDSDASDDPIEPDLPPVVEECTAAFADPFRPIYGTPEAFGGDCPFAVNEQHVKVLGNGPAIGLMMVERCAEGCSSCQGEPLPLGVVGLDEFTVPLVVMAQNEELVCLTVQTGTLRGVDETRCLYDSLWVGGLQVDLLLAVHRVSQLPFAGMALLGGKPPPVQGEQLTDCSCGSLYELGDSNLECCAAAQGQPFVSSLTFLDTDVAPGESGNVALDGGEWGFHVAQAQLLPSCDDANSLTVNQSWALVRGQ